MHDAWINLIIGAAMIWAKLHDPLGWVVLIFALVLGHNRHALWTPLMLSAVATVVNVAMVWSWWQQLGVPWQPHTIRVAIAFTLLAYTVFAIGRLIFKLKSIATPPSQS